MSETPMLRCEGLEKSFSGVRVLKGVSLAVGAGKVLCIAGENGAGKSTLMNLIGGVHHPDAGTMTLSGVAYAPATPLQAAAAGVAFVHQELNLFPNLSIAENIFITGYPQRAVLGLSVLDPRAAMERSSALLGEVGLKTPPNTHVEELPLGDRQLVEIARALQLDARVIIFDEPTTSLTTNEAERLFAIISDLKARGLAILYISHALEHVLALADDILVLRDGELIRYGPRSEFTHDALITAMVGRSIEQLYPPRRPVCDGDVVLRVSGVSQPGVVEGISFELRTGEILGIAGLMGSGRSELARILFGLDPASAGTVELAGESLNGLSPRERIARGLAFVTESRRDDGLFVAGSIDENLRIVHPDAADVGRLLRDLHVAFNNAAQPVGQLSGGNQQKVALAKWLAKPPRVLILDEPTRGIDVGAKQEIYMLMAQLAADGMALLVISSEVEELVGLCDRILVMARGEIRAELQQGCTREQILKAAV